MFNNVTLIGYLGSDAESRPTRNNSTLTVLSSRPSAPGRTVRPEPAKRRPPWHKSVAFGRTAEYAARFTKGAHVQIVGEIQTREYAAKDGTKKSVTEIRMHRITRLDRASKAESTEAAA